MLLVWVLAMATEAVIKKPGSITLRYVLSVQADQCRVQSGKNEYWYLRPILRFL